MMDQKSSSVTKFGMVLGIYFAFKFLIAFNPIFRSGLILIGGVVVGMFWPFLTLKQNTMIGLTRFLMNLSVDFKLVTRFTLYVNLALDYLKHRLFPLYAEMLELATRDFQYSQIDIRRGLATWGFDYLKSHSFLVAALGVFTLSFLMYFIEPYLFYRLAKWRGFYNQIPFGEKF